MDKIKIIGEVTTGVYSIFNEDNKQLENIDEINIKLLPKTNSVTCQIKFRNIRGEKLENRYPPCYEITELILLNRGFKND